MFRSTLNIKPRLDWLSAESDKKLLTDANAQAQLDRNLVLKKENSVTTIVKATVQAVTN